MLRTGGKELDALERVDFAKIRAREAEIIRSLRPISTVQLSALLRLHLPPIKQVIYLRP